MEQPGFCHPCDGVVDVLFFLLAEQMQVVRWRLVYGV
jgi:hypothetical protein